MRRLALIAALVAAVAAGCGGTTIDGGELEDEIKEDASGEGLVIDDVDCPSREAETGDTFECTVTVKGEDSPLEIVQRDDDGNVTYDLAPLLEGIAGSTIDGGELEDEIKTDASREGLVVDDVACPSPEAKTGDTFECTVTVKGEDKPLEVVQENGDGNVTYDLGPLLEGTAGTDAGGDETSVRFVIDAVNKDVTALCDYATAEYRKELETDENCAKAVLDEYDTLLEDYEVSLDGDNAAASDGERTVTLERQKDGSWLITDVR
jgi:hypothetical protein